RRGLLWRYLQAAGVSFSFSTTAVVLAQTIVALPFLVLSLEGAARGLGRRHEEVAATRGAGPCRRLTRGTLPPAPPGPLSARGLGRRHDGVAASLAAGPWRRLTRGTLPRVAPGLLSGCVRAFARALGEFGATLTFAGSAQGRTRTLPLELYLQRETDPDAAVTLALLLVVLATVIVGTVYARTIRPERAR